MAKRTKMRVVENVYPTMLSIMQTTLDKHMDAYENIITALVLCNGGKLVIDDNSLELVLGHFPTYYSHADRDEAKGTTTFNLFKQRDPEIPDAKTLEALNPLYVVTNKWARLIESRRDIRRAVCQHFGAILLSECLMHVDYESLTIMGIEPAGKFDNAVLKAAKAIKEAGIGWDQYC